MRAIISRGVFAGASIPHQVSAATPEMANSLTLAVPAAGGPEHGRE